MTPLRNASKRVLKESKLLNEFGDIDEVWLKRKLNGITDDFAGVMDKEKEFVRQYDIFRVVVVTVSVPLLPPLTFEMTNYTWHR